MAQSTPARGRAAWPSGDDYTVFSLIVVCAGLAIYAYLAWTHYHSEISRGFAWIAHWHIAAIRSLTHDYDGLDRQLLSADYARVTPAGIGAAATSIGLWFRVPATALLAALALLCLVRSNAARFTRRLDLDGLIAEQAGSFRTISAFAGRRLRLTQPAATQPRPADPALHVDEWVRCFARRRDGSIDHEAARAELVRQLGPAWTGPHRAEDHVRVLFAAFALHLAQRREAALTLLGDLAEALGPAGPEGETGPDTKLTLPAALVGKADAALTGAILAQASTVASSHAFTAPALMTLLTEARRRAGVLPPAAFNGVKLVDRPLWYALHSLGFPAEGRGRSYHPNPCVEAIGARDHWAVETELGTPVREPSVDRALAAILAAAAATTPQPSGPKAAP